MQVGEKREIKAVHTVDLSSILEKLGKLTEFTNGNISCNICGEKITLENIGSLKKVNGEIQFTCSKSSCYNEVVKTMNT